jgi:hypothetical protein
VDGVDTFDHSVRELASVDVATALREFDPQIPKIDISLA